jgi:hypothetical protein
MKISKIMLIAFTALAAITTFAACEKDKDDKTPVAIEGRWIGTYVNAASGNTFYFSFDIKPGGIIEEINNAGQKVGEGTWELDPATNVLMANYTWTNGQEFSIIAAFDKQNGRLLGDWGYDNSNTNGGTWEMTKSN